MFISALHVIFKRQHKIFTIIIIIIIIIIINWHN